MNDFPSLTVRTPSLTDIAGCCDRLPRLWKDVPTRGRILGDTLTAVAVVTSEAGEKSNLRAN